jgi:hypothetical protein
VAHLANPEARLCARSWAIDRGTEAHKQSQEPPGFLCCLSLLAGGFWPTTETPRSNLKLFQWNGKAVGGSLVYEMSIQDWNTALLYMYTNMEEMDKYFV